MLRDALDVLLEVFELLLQIVLALGDLLGLVVGNRATAPRVRIAAAGAQRLLQIVGDLTLALVELLRAAREILERLAHRRLPLGRELLQRFLKLTPRVLDGAPRLLGAHLLLLLTLAARLIHGLQRLVQLIDRLLRLAALAAAVRLLLSRLTGLALLPLLALLALLPTGRDLPRAAALGQRRRRRLLLLADGRLRGRR